MTVSQLRQLASDNGYALTADQGTLYEFVMGVAAGEIDEAGASKFFEDYTEPLD